MLIVTCLSLFGLVLACLYYWYKRPRSFPPGPRGIPFLGVIPFLGKIPERVLFKWSKIYGPVMSLRIGRKDWISLNDYDSINQALAKQHTKFSGRPKNPVYAQFNQGCGVVRIDYGALWKSQRKFGLTTLRGFGVGKRSMEDRIVEEAAFMNEWVRSQNGKAFSPLDILHKAAASNIGSVVFGQRFDYDDEILNKLISLITGVYDNAAANFALQCMNLAPILMNIPPFSTLNHHIVNTFNTLLELLHNFIEQHKKTFQKNELRDFIDAFLKEMDEGNPGFTDDQLVQYVRDLFSAGTDTTATTLNWGLICLLHYPQIQTKLREEILKVVGLTSPVRLSHAADLHYTNAFIQELMRFRTIVPLSVFHKTNENAEINGFVIPKDTGIMVNLWAVHNDPDYWKEPDIFKPERFIDEKGNFVKSSHLVAFSVGPRHCLGEQLARMEVFLFLVSLVQNFEFLPDPDSGELPPLDCPVSGFIFTPSCYKIFANNV
ncbi:unnamed protein product [Clavelina lepadiformis]|uniref:Cytochrome P450 n=1 Tax=Clavelina lepadiformis TaxID=159417 RepID=A0ABP0FI02_CLALP